MLSGHSSGSFPLCTGVCILPISEPVRATEGRGVRHRLCLRGLCPYVLSVLPDQFIGHRTHCLSILPVDMPEMYSSTGSSLMCGAEAPALRLVLQVLIVAMVFLNCCAPRLLAGSFLPRVGRAGLCARAASLYRLHAEMGRKGSARGSPGERRLLLEAFRSGARVGANILGGMTAIRQPIAKPAWLASMKRKMAPPAPKASAMPARRLLRG